MKKKLLILFVFFYTLCFSQQSRYKGFFIQPEVGLLIYEKENLFKENSFQTSGTLGKEFLIMNNISIIGGLRLDNIKGNYYFENNSYYFDKKFVGVPIYLRMYSSAQSDTSMFVSLGIESKFKVYDKIENVALNEEVMDNKGFHLGGLVEVGYRAKVVSNLDFFVGMNYRDDLLQAGYDNGNKEKIQNNVNIFIGFEIFKKDN